MERLIIQYSVKKTYGLSLSKPFLCLCCRRKQQNPAPKARLLPLTDACIFGSSAEAAKSCFHGANAAFDPGAFHPGQSMNAELAKMTDTT